MTSRLAPGLRLLGRCSPSWTSNSGRVYIFFCTFLIYALYHLCRKPISVVKSVLHQNCSEVARREGKTIVPENGTFCDWEPFDGDNYNSLFGALDLAYLSAYAACMFLSGQIADRVHLRHYLSVGSILCGLSTIAFGLGYFFDVHAYTFYLLVQLIAGAVQATGWPAVVSSLGNWFGKSKRGFFMGVWNSHTSVGNILGSIVAGAFVDEAWGWSFVVPGLMITVSGLLTFLFLAPYPEELGLPSPDHSIPKDFNYAPQTDSTEQPNETPELNYEDIIAESTSTVELIPPDEQPPQAVSIISALRVPGVIEYSLCLFFGKMVSYTFLFWLPDYIRATGGFNPSAAADLSAVFDLGGIVGGILAGLIADRSGSSATVCFVMLFLSVPMLCIYYFYGAQSAGSCVGWLIPLGLLVNGPYTLITTAVSADLGTHSSLSSNARAMATVTGIIDGTGSVGAALGPLLCGLLKPYGWSFVFLMLTIALILAPLLLLRRVYKELYVCCRIRERSTVEAVIT